MGKGRTFSSSSSTLLHGVSLLCGVPFCTVFPSAWCSFLRGVPFFVFIVIVIVIIIVIIIVIVVVVVVVVVVVIIVVIVVVVKCDIIKDERTRTLLTSFTFINFCHF